MADPQSLAVIVLAAGKGMRMKSNLPKVLHPIANQSMIAHVLGAVEELQPEKIMAVIAPDMEAVKESVSKTNSSVSYAIQSDQKGTGHAVRCAMENLGDFHGNVLVIYGDTPLWTAETLQKLVAQKLSHGAALALSGMKLDDPTGYGRLLMDSPPYVNRIAECKDANEQEKSIQWVWGGVMVFDAEFLRNGLEQLTPSPVTGEFYLTELVEMAAKGTAGALNVSVDSLESLGVNSRVQQAQAEHILQQRLREQHMENGVTLVAPGTVFFSADTQIGQDTIIQPNVTFGTGVEIGSGVEIRAFCHLEKCRVGNNSVIGPYARLRPKSILAEGVKIGNFVELKASNIAAGAKISHLSYVGDANVGEEANVGAGTITCNYDGYSKYTTEIGAGAFIGSNTSLVAPVSVGSGAIIGAGSVVTEDVPDDALSLERSQQVVREGAAARIRDKKKA